MNLYDGERCYTLAKKDSEASFKVARVESGRNIYLDATLAATVDAPWKFAGKELLGLLKDSHTEVGPITNEEVAGRKLTRIEFRRWKGDGSKAELNFSGWIQLDPDRGWVIDSYHRVDPKDRITDAHLTYEGDGDTLRLASVATRFVNKKLDRVNDTTYRLTGFHEGGASDRDFQLAAFGLPEVGRPAKASRNSGVPFLVFGLAAVALGVAIRLKFLAARSSKTRG